MTDYSYISLLVVFLLVCLGITEASPPALFIFGDSSSDVGTNNHISYCPLRGDLPHGIDLPAGVPPGRFSNGYNTVDFISKLFGFSRSPQSYMAASCTGSSGFKRGVNFASGGALLRDKTGQTTLVSITEQVKQFISVHENLKALMGNHPTFDYFISNSIFIFSVGTNDILANFVNYKTVLSKEPFIKDMMLEYEYRIKELYSYGARRFGFISPLAVGCVPGQRIFNVTGGCLQAQNEISLTFYFELDLLLYRISSELPGFKYSHGNTYEMMMEVISNPSMFNMKIVDTACCGGGRLNAEQICQEGRSLCENRDEYAFWDGVNPTQNASYLVAKTLFDGSQRFVSPINFYQLAADIRVMLQ